jgi:hypothetical protein
MSTARLLPNIERKSVGKQQHQSNPHPDRCSMGDSREDFIAWLTASCRHQGVPVTITDPTTLATIATLLS